MIKFITTKRLYLLLAFIILLLVLLFFANLAITRENPGGFDFFTHWYATRIYIKDGVNPYSELSNSRIAEAMGQALDPATDEIFRFSAPLFSILVLTPFSLVGDFNIARALWMTFQEMSLLAIVWLLSIHLTHKKKFIVIAILALLIVFSLPSITAILNGSLTIVALLFFVLAVALINRQSDEAAGLLLSFSLIKAELFYPGIILLLLWALIRGRRRLVWWFLSTFALLIGFSILLIPDWVISYLRVILTYSEINPLSSLIAPDYALNWRLNLVKTVALVILLVLEWIVVKFQGKSKIAWNFGLLFTMLPWFGSSIHIEQTILYMPALIIIIGLFLNTWKENIHTGILIVPIFLFILTWIFSGLFISGISIVLSRIIIYVLQPSLVLIFFYWIRWWVLRSEKFTIQNN